MAEIACNIVLPSISVRVRNIYYTYHFTYSTLAAVAFLPLLVVSMEQPPGPCPQSENATKAAVSRLLKIFVFALCLCTTNLHVRSFCDELTAWLECVADYFAWRMDGFISHCSSVSATYKRQCSRKHDQLDSHAAQLSPLPHQVLQGISSICHCYLLVSSSI